MKNGSAKNFADPFWVLRHGEGLSRYTCRVCCIWHRDYKAWAVGRIRRRVLLQGPGSRPVRIRRQGLQAQRRIRRQGLQARQRIRRQGLQARQRIRRQGPWAQRYNRRRMLGQLYLCREWSELYRAGCISYQSLG
ncbi:hypothetical protein [Anaerotruncus rubiinfantis]|uniref:hypothetical protein n=1 Tax=Anaerotruncus rubiinfantis TaxID=1720200 RepID=UPI0034A2358B